MNNYNNIYSVIKKHCGGDLPDEAVNLDKILAEITISNGLNSVYQYLDVMQDLGLIHYSTIKQTIYLTDKGRYKDKLFG